MGKTWFCESQTYKTTGASTANLHAEGHEAHLKCPCCTCNLTGGATSSLCNQRELGKGMSLCLPSTSNQEPDSSHHFDVWSKRKETKISRGKKRSKKDGKNHMCSPPGAPDCWGPQRVGGKPWWGSQCSWETLTQSCGFSTIKALGTLFGLRRRIYLSTVPHGGHQGVLKF